MKIRTTLVIDIETEFDDDPENTDETVRFCVEEDLKEIGYDVYDCEIKESHEKELPDVPV